MPAVALPVPEPPEPRGIVDLVAEHTVLHPLGATQLQGSCPFCGSTAFRVRPSPYGTFHCFRCGVGGNAAMFAEKIGHHR
jgi:DNA primase